jgi:hypothetical protein
MKSVLSIALLLALTACSSNDNDNDANDNTALSIRYQVEITNLTHAQPFSPPVIILHDESFQAWTTGEAASTALEVLAEGGDSSELIAASSSTANFRGNGELLAGTSLRFEIGTNDSSYNHLTLATMLVNSNDAFSGLANIDVGALQQGDKRVYLTPGYDAGTEFNDELASTIPGPAGGGEGFNKARDDVTTSVTYHGGIVSKDDGYTASTLSEADRFDNPVMRIEITRL